MSPSRFEGGSPNVPPSPKSRSETKSKNQGAKRNLIPNKPLQTATPHPLTVISRKPYFKPPQLTPSSCQPKPEFPGISTCCSFHNPACPTDSFLFIYSFFLTLFILEKNFSITDQPVFAYRQPCAFGCIMIAVRYSPCSSQAEKISMGNDGVRWRLGFGGSAVRQVTLCVGGTGLPWGCHPIPRLGISSPNPISASRRLKAAFVCQPSVRFRFAP